MRDKKRVMSLFLSTAMALSAIPTTVFASNQTYAAEDVSVSAIFAPDSIDSGVDGESPVLTIDLDGVTSFDAVSVLVDWGSLASYTSDTFNKTFSIGDESSNPSFDVGSLMGIIGAPSGSTGAIFEGKYQSGGGGSDGASSGGSSGTSSITLDGDSERVISLFGTGAVSNDGDLLTIKFDELTDIPDGNYDVTISVVHLYENDTKVIDLADKSSWATTTTTLTVGNSASATKDVTVGTQTNGSLTLTGESADGKVTPGDTVTFDLQPNEGFKTPVFTGLPEGTNVTISPDGSSGSFVMPDENVTINVEFQPEVVEKFSVAIGAMSNGSISLTNPPAENKYAKGETVNFTISPSAGYEVGTVTVDGVQVTINPDKTSGYFTMPANEVTINATFTEVANEYRITLGDLTYGEIAGLTDDGEITADGEVVESGSVIKFKVTLDDNPSDLELKGPVITNTTTGTKVTATHVDGESSDGNFGPGCWHYYTFTMPSGNVTIDASIQGGNGSDYIKPEITEYAIDVASSEYGTIKLTSANAQDGTVTAGEKVTFTVTPNSDIGGKDYGVSNVTVSNVDSQDVSIVKDPETGVWTCTFTMPAKAVTVSASYTEIDDGEADTYTVSLGTYENGNVVLTDSGKTSYAEGEKVQLTVTPDSKYDVVSGSIKATGTPDSVTATKVSGPEANGSYVYEFIMPGNAVTIDAKFEPAEEIDETLRDVTVNFVDGDGVVSFKNNIHSYKPGDTVEFSVEAGNKFKISAIEATGGLDVKQVSGNAYGGTYQFTMPANAVTVNFIMVDRNEGETDIHNISVAPVTNGSITLGTQNATTTAKTGDEVVFYVSANTGYEISSVSVSAANHETVNVTGGTASDIVDGAYAYRFTMPDSDVTISAVISETDPTDPAEDTFTLTGRVVTNNNRVLEGAKVQIVSSSGGVNKTVVTNSNGYYNATDLPAGYNYEIKATYDVANSGAPVVGQLVESSSYSLRPDQLYPVTKFDMTLELKYTYDVDGNGGDDVETVYAGPDDRFETIDDYYEDTVGSKPVKVYPTPTGDPDDDSASFFKEASAGEESFGKYNYYYWDVNHDSVMEKVYAGGSQNHVVGDSNDFYLLDHDKDVNTNDLEVYIGKDNIPGTHDDYYQYDVTGDSVIDTVYAGKNNHFHDRENWYGMDVDKTGGIQVDINDHSNTNDKVYVGDDEVPYTADDYYFINADGNAENGNEQVFAGEDGKLFTDDDYYQADINGDGVLENIEIGDDLVWASQDDHYKATIESTDGTQSTVVNVYPGVDNKFGNLGDGECDDFYHWDTNKDGATNNTDLDGSNHEDKIYVSKDAIAGTEDDYYYLNADSEDGDEQIFVGKDEYPLTGDDHYIKDVNGDGNNETVYPGDDNTWVTEDDYYLADPDKDGDQDKILAGADKVIGTADDKYIVDADEDGELEDVFVGGDRIPGTSDDWYYHDTNKDGDTDDESDKVIAGEDGIIGTEDDYYVADPDKDGENENVYVGPDTKPGTSDDWYIHDTNKDGDTDDENDKVIAGEDGIIGTEDDYYVADPDKDGENEQIFVGPDTKPGTSDDWYYHDTNKDGDTDDDCDKVIAGEDGNIGTEDDYYVTDPDKDGDDDKVYVGPDTKPGTSDDWYEVDINGDGDTDDENDKVTAGEDGIIGTEDDEYVADTDKDGDDEDNFVGPDTKPGTDDDWYYADITFNAGSGTISGGGSSVTYRQDELEDMGTLPTASRSGYTFVGWSRTSNGSTLTLDQIMMLKGDTTLYAVYTGNSTGGGGGSTGGGGGSSVTTKVTVKFDSNGGSSVASQTVDKNSTIKEPSDPTRKGYEFTGWFTDDDCTKAFDFSTKITKSMTLYAGWDVADEDGENGENGNTGGNGNSDNAVFETLTSDHVAYIVGYEDGLIHGGYNMTRAEAAMVFYRLLTDEARAKYETSTENFIDVDSNAWYTTAVATLAKAGIVEGVGDNMFKPNASITRAEFATICVRIGDLNASMKNPFSDVSSNHWAYNYILSAVEEGWIVGYPDGTFKSNNTITRSEVVTMLNRVLLRDDINAESIKDYVDDVNFVNWADNTNETAWDYYQLIEAGNGHTYERDENGVEIWTSIDFKLDV